MGVWVSGPDRRESLDRKTGGEIPPTHVNHRVEKWWCGLLPELVLSRLVAPPLQPSVVGSFPGRGCMVSQPFATRGNRSYLEFWVVTGNPWYPGYFTPIVAPEPSLEWVVGAGHSMVGRTGSHKVLWALLWD
jgi:hypothetical protein